MRYDDKKLPYTLYWLDGKREIIYGESAGDAWAKAGLSAGAIPALDFNVGGGCNRYNFDTEKKEWVKRETTRIAAKDRAVDLTRTELAQLLSLHGGVEIELPSKDLLAIEEAYGHYSSGWCKYVKVYFAAYNEGPYWDDGEEKCHYMVAGTAHFEPTNLDGAITHLLNLHYLWHKREKAKGTVEEVSARKNYENAYQDVREAVSIDHLINSQETLPL